MGANQETVSGWTTPLANDEWRPPRRPDRWWAIGYLAGMLGGAVLLWLVVLYLVFQDGDFGSPGGFVFAMATVFLAGGIGGALLVAVAQLGTMVFLRVFRS